jgi:hypothetical protein
LIDRRSVRVFEISGLFYNFEISSKFGLTPHRCYTLNTDVLSQCMPKILLTSLQFVENELKQKQHDFDFWNGGILEALQHAAEDFEEAGAGDSAHPGMGEFSMSSESAEFLGGEGQGSGSSGSGGSHNDFSHLAAVRHNIGTNANWRCGNTNALHEVELAIQDIIDDLPHEGHPFMFAEK